MDALCRQMFCCAFQVLVYRIPISNYPALNPADFGMSNVHRFATTPTPTNSPIIQRGDWDDGCKVRNFVRCNQTNKQTNKQSLVTYQLNGRCWTRGLIDFCCFSFTAKDQANCKSMALDSCVTKNDVALESLQHCQGAHSLKAKAKYVSHFASLFLFLALSGG